MQTLDQKKKKKRKRQQNQHRLHNQVTKRQKRSRCFNSSDTPIVSWIRCSQRDGVITEYSLGTLFPVVRRVHQRSAFSRHSWTWRHLNLPCTIVAGNSSLRRALYVLQERELHPWIAKSPEAFPPKRYIRTSRWSLIRYRVRGKNPRWCRTGVVKGARARAFAEIPSFRCKINYPRKRRGLPDYVRRTWYTEERRYSRPLN